jgi:hypothetical protein
MKQILLKLVVMAISPRLAGRFRAMWGVLKELAPYAAIELVLPGGTILAILCWLYRRRRSASRSLAQQGSVTGNDLMPLIRMRRARVFSLAEPVR